MIESDVEYHLIQGRKISIKPYYICYIKSNQIDIKLYLFFDIKRI